jgi:hypothetical protein
MGCGKKIPILSKLDYQAFYDRLVAVFGGKQEANTQWIRQVGIFHDSHVIMQVAVSMAVLKLSLFAAEQGSPRMPDDPLTYTFEGELESVGGRTNWTGGI